VTKRVHVDDGIVMVPHIDAARNPDDVIQVYLFEEIGTFKHRGAYRRTALGLTEEGDERYVLVPDE
jgi:hypothetical protein